MTHVESLIPHRPPFLFVDDIVEWADDKIVCRRVVRGDEPQFAGHYPGNPIMPGVLLCEAVFQAAACFMAKRAEVAGGNNGHLTPILARIGEARFRQRIVPGDELLIEASFKETVANFHFMRGRILKGGKVALTVEFALALVDEQTGTAAS
jgi:3-hydroxyacyl-[acyl-carrier-protein] dehydratase